MEKELALAIEFAKAPKELQDAAKLHYDNLKALEAAKTSLLNLNKEIFNLEVTAGELGKKYAALLKAWDVNGIKAVK